jgi:hypothetical protein
MRTVARSSWNRLDVSDDLREELCALYAGGDSLKSIAELTGLSQTWLSDKFRLWRPVRDAAAVAEKRKLPASTLGSAVPFLSTWTPESAWVWGLWFGDGWLRPYRVSLASSEDVARQVQALTGFKSALHKGSGCVHFDLGGIAVVRLVAERFGLQPGPKSACLVWPNPPRALVPHFMRGLCDSDGSWGVTRDGYLTFTYCSKSEGFVGSFRDCAVAAGCKYRPVERMKGDCFIVRWSGTSAVRLGHFVYADSVVGTRYSRRHAIWFEHAT